MGGSDGARRFIFSARSNSFDARRGGGRMSNPTVCVAGVEEQRRFFVYLSRLRSSASDRTRGCEGPDTIEATRLEEREGPAG